jgi:hypothetical protein
MAAIEPHAVRSATRPVAPAGRAGRSARQTHTTTTVRPGIRPPGRRATVARPRSTAARRTPTGTVPPAEPVVRVPTALRGCPPTRSNRSAAAATRSRISRRPSTVPAGAPAVPGGTPAVPRGSIARRRRPADVSGRSIAPTARPSGWTAMALGATRPGRPRVAASGSGRSALAAVVGLPPGARPPRRGRGAGRRSPPGGRGL